MYICEVCGRAFDHESGALDCEKIHKLEEQATNLLKDGKTLEEINEICNFKWKLRDDLKQVTKDNCFIISWWQCCGKPAYRITQINGWGVPYLSGKGGWSGYYGGYVKVYQLPDPHPKEDLFIY